MSEPGVRASALSPLVALRLEVEDFLSHEAELVDERRFDEWLALFSDDLQYRMPIARNVLSHETQDEYLDGALDVAWFDEGKATLATRVAQLKTRVHWAEEPVSRTVHLVSNVRVARATPSPEAAGEVEVRCKFLVYRNRNEGEQDTLIGRRHDVLRRHGEAWLICRRTVYVAQTVLLANSLSFFV